MFCSRFSFLRSRSVALLHLRQFSKNLERNDESTKPIALKDALKRFYLLVHPDRLAHRPTERTVNERSFAALQQYLDDYQIASRVDSSDERSPLRLAPADPRSVDLTFFLRSNADAHDSSSALTRINVALSTPARAANVRPDVRHLEHTCRSLFKAANLSCDFFVDATFQSCASDASSAAAESGKGATTKRRRPRPQASSLSDVLHKDSVSFAEAADVLSSLARHLYSQREVAEREADVVHAAFLHSQAIRVAFNVTDMKDGVPPPQERLRLLLQLQAAIRRNDKAHLANLNGLTFVISSNVDKPIDDWGRIVLAEWGDEDEWTATVLNADLASVRNNKFDTTNLEALEDRVARLFGVAIVYTDEKSVRAATMQYARLLDESDLLRAPPLTLNVDQSLGLQLTCAPDASFSLVPNLGVFSVPIKAYLPEIRRFVSGNAIQLAREFENHTRFVREQERAVAEVRRMFGLRRLTFDRHSVTLQQVRRCLSRMRERHQVELEGVGGLSDDLAMLFLPNVCMRIVGAAYYSVSDDGYLQIPYDFEWNSS
jgi:hypothetical protein